MKDNKKDYFYLHDMKLFKIFWWVASTFFAIALVAFVVLYGGMIYDHFAAGDNIESIIPAFRSIVGVLLIALFVVFIAFLTVFIFNYVFNAAQYAENIENGKVMCPLSENGVRHEEEICAMFKKIAKPAPGTNNLNRANTVHFLRALKSMDLINPNENRKILMLWAQQVTGYEERSFSAFNQAMTKQKDNPALVAEYSKQLEQIISE